MNLVARTYAGLEGVLADELKSIGAENINIVKRAVEFTGDRSVMYSANLWLRTAIDVLVPIHNFKARTPEELYKGVQQIDWSQYFNERNTFSLTPIVHSSHFTHSQYAMLKAKDAIVDQFRDRSGNRPDIDRNEPDIRIVLRISEHKCSVLLNSSGDSLFKRGYKKEIGDAPINEVLAAGILALSEWDGNTPFVDPMCGSGTFLIEAAMKALNIAPGILRSGFGFEKWMDFDSELWERIFFEAKSKIEKKRVKIKGFDTSNQMVRIAKNNLASFRELRNLIKIEQADFFTLNKPYDEGIVMTNPPYDKRIKLQDDVSFYSDLGSRLKHHWTGYDAWIISSNLSAIKRVGLKPKRKFTLFNGPDEARLIHLPLYDGSKRHG